MPSRQRLADAERVLAGGPTRHLSHQHHGYVARGRYAEQLERMWTHVDRDRCLVLYTADLERDPDAVMQRVHDFLGIPVRPTAETRRWNRQDTARSHRRAAGPAGGSLRAVRRVAGRAPRGTAAVADVTARPEDDSTRRGDPLDDASRSAGAGRSTPSAAVCFALLGLRARHHHHPVPGRARRRRVPGGGGRVQHPHPHLGTGCRHQPGAVRRPLPRPRPRRLVRPMLVVALVPVAVAATAVAARLLVVAGPLGRLIGDAATEDQIATYLRLMAPFIPVAALYMTLDGCAQGFGSMVPSVAVERIGRPLLVAGLVLGTVVAGTGTTALAISWATPWAVGFVAIAVWVTKLLTRAEGRNPGTPHLDRRTLATRFWRFAVPRSLGAMLQMGILWADTLLLGALGLDPGGRRVRRVDPVPDRRHLRRHGDHHRLRPADQHAAGPGRAGADRLALQDGNGVVHPPRVADLPDRGHLLARSGRDLRVGVRRRSDRPHHRRRGVPVRVIGRSDRHAPAHGGPQHPEPRQQHRRPGDQHRPQPGAHSVDGASRRRAGLVGQPRADEPAPHPRGPPHHGAPPLRAHLAASRPGGRRHGRAAHAGRAGRARPRPARTRGRPDGGGDRATRTTVFRQREHFHLDAFLAGLRRRDAEAPQPGDRAVLRSATTPQ